MSDIRLLSWWRFGILYKEYLIQFFFLERLCAAKEEAGNSMIKYQQIVFPLCTEIQVIW